MKELVKYIFVILLAVIFSLLVFRFSEKINDVKHAPVNAEDDFTKAIETAKQLQKTFAMVAEKAMPAVVRIKVQQKIPCNRIHKQPRSSNPYDDLLNKFFERNNPDDDRYTIPLGQASGFLVRENGYILTNYHVVKNSNVVQGEKAYTVALKDGSEFPAKLVGADPKVDLAVLKIDAKKTLPYLKFGDSVKVKIGHWTIAIGAPFNFDYTVTAGIVSQKRGAVGMNVYENYIQTDASINPGNSGGPLLNLDGEVIGVNDFIFTSPLTQGNIGLSFAIASDLAKKICDELIETGTVVRPWLGISMQNLTEKMRKQHIVDHGVLVREVQINEPADKAGVEPGDIIQKIDGRKINNTQDALRAIFERKPGDKISLTINRDGKIQRINVIASKQAPMKLADAKSELKHKNVNTILNLLGFSIAAKNKRIFIEKVIYNSPAAMAGLRKGTEIISINHQTVTNISEATEAITAGLSQGAILLNVSDGHCKRQLVIRLR